MSSPFVVASLTSVTPIPVTSGGTGVSTSTGSGQVVLSNTPTLITPVLGAATGTSVNLSGSISANSATLVTPLSVASGGTGVAASSGTGSVVLNTSPTLVTPTLGVASATSLTLSNALPVLSGGTGVTTKTGTGSVVLSTSPTLSGTAICDVMNGGIFTASSYIDAGSRIGTTQTFAGPNAGGTFLSWNKNLDGVSHFINQKGSGSGGFSWLAYNSGNTLTGTPMTLSTTGDLTILGALSAPSASFGTALPVGSGGTGTTTSTGTGSTVLNTSPTLVSPALGAATATSLSLTAPLGVLSGGTGVTTSTGTGSTVLSAAPTLTGSITINGTIALTQSGGGGIAIVNTSSSSGIDGLTIYAPNGNNIGINLGNAATTGNSVQLYYNQTSNNSAANYMAVGFAGKSPNMQFLNDRTTATYGIRNYASGLFTTGNPDMSSQGFGVGWNYSGNGESIFYNNNANGTVSGGWQWKPCTNSTIGTPVMTLSQAGDLSVVGNITGGNLNFSQGTWTPYLSSNRYSPSGILNNYGISIVYSVGKYWINGKSVTLYFSMKWDTNPILSIGAPADNIIIGGIPTVALLSSSVGANSNTCTIYGYLDPIQTNLAGTANPIQFSIQPGTQLNYGPGQLYDIPPWNQGPQKPSPSIPPPGTFDGQQIFLNYAYPIPAYTGQTVTCFITYPLP